MSFVFVQVQITHEYAALLSFIYSVHWVIIVGWWETDWKRLQMKEQDKSWTFLGSKPIINNKRDRLSDSKIVNLTKERKKDKSADRLKDRQTGQIKFVTIRPSANLCLNYSREQKQQR
jgi:hypothetical protein